MCLSGCYLGLTFPSLLAASSSLSPNTICQPSLFCHTRKNKQPGLLLPSIVPPFCAKYSNASELPQGSCVPKPPIPLTKNLFSLTLLGVGALQIRASDPLLCMKIAPAFL